MKVSRTVGYALLALGYVAQKEKKGSCVLSQEIAKRYKVPLEYLLKIMQQLVKARILRSKRGPRGGFNLNQAPSKISLLDVVVAVDGPGDGAVAGFEGVKNKDKFITKTERAMVAAHSASEKILRDTKVSTLLA